MTNPRPDGGRAALAGFVTNRLGRTPPRPQAVRTAEPAQDPSVLSFETLPGYRELKLQRSAADLIGLGNPFFHVHETKARGGPPPHAPEADGDRGPQAAP